MGMLALVASITLVISCQKETEQTSGLEVTQTIAANRVDAPAAHWDYENQDWADEGYPDCGGVQQSPINIITSTAAYDQSLTSISFSYVNNTPLNEVDNGHTLQIVNTASNSITVNGSTYDLLQFHFHAGSEHEINGVQSPMEIHFVHKNSTTNQIAVVGVMVKEGLPNLQIAKIFNNWPSVTEDTIATGKNIRLASLLPLVKSYYTYPGSLTTPPCTEGLQWLVLKWPIFMSHAQIEYFKTHYDHNFRELQDLNGRVVKKH